MIGIDNCSHTTLHDLGERFGLEPLLGKTCVFITDAQLGDRTDSGGVVERLKSITGEDMKTVDRKNKPAIASCRLKTKFFVTANEPPKLRDASAALAARFVILRFPNCFLGKEDFDLEPKLLEEMGGILVWASQGLVRLRQRGRFVEPTFSGSLRKVIESSQSPVRAFVLEHCVVQAEAETPVDEIFQEYKAWAEASGLVAISKSTFGLKLFSVVPGIGTSRPRIGSVRVRCYSGIRLKTSAELEDDPVIVGSNWSQQRYDQINPGKQGENRSFCRPGHSGHSFPQLMEKKDGVESKDAFAAEDVKNKGEVSPMTTMTSDPGTQDLSAIFK